MVWSTGMVWSKVGSGQEGISFYAPEIRGINSACNHCLAQIKSHSVWIYIHFEKMAYLLYLIETYFIYLAMSNVSIFICDAD